MQRLRNQLLARTRFTRHERRPEAGAATRRSLENTSSIWGLRPTIFSKLQVRAEFVIQAKSALALACVEYEGLNPLVQQIRARRAS